jgi:hypothetical protein
LLCETIQMAPYLQKTGLRYFTQTWRNNSFRCLLRRLPRPQDVGHLRLTNCKFFNPFYNLNCPKDDLKSQSNRHFPIRFKIKIKLNRFTQNTNYLLLPITIPILIPILIHILILRTIHFFLFFPRWAEICNNFLTTFLTTFWQFFDNCWQFFDTFLTTLWQLWKLFDKFWQLFGI